MFDKQNLFSCRFLEIDWARLLCRFFLFPVKMHSYYKNLK